MVFDGRFNPKPQNKSEALELCSDAVCVRRDSPVGVAYIVYRNRHEADQDKSERGYARMVAAASTATDAWNRAIGKLTTHPTPNQEQR